ncbi:hypothetical protein, partial [Pseudomonas juntendi]|uniref:hypothetical protein n=1 Tax=Pseudomonas juntendi TaxID=2666183 RepID=UPI0032085069
MGWARLSADFCIGFFAGSPAPKGLMHGSRAAKSLWEILWFSASQFPAFGDVFALISHQGECDASELASQ